MTTTTPGAQAGPSRYEQLGGTPVVTAAVASLRHEIVGAGWA